MKFFTKIIQEPYDNADFALSKYRDCSVVMVKNTLFFTLKIHGLPGWGSKKYPYFFTVEIHGLPGWGSKKYPIF